MSVMLDTSLGEIVVDLYTKKAPLACTNFLKLCKIKYYNYALIENIQKNFIVEINGKPGAAEGGESVWGVIHGEKRRFFTPELNARMKHNQRGLVSFATQSTKFEGVLVAGSRFFITLSDSHLEYLDGVHSIFGRIAEGMEVLDEFNKTVCDMEGRPYSDLRIKHTYILDDPFEDIAEIRIPSRSPSPSEDILKIMRLKKAKESKEEIDKETLEEMRRKEDAESRKLTLEMVGDLPFAEIKPPENVLFVCKLSYVTNDEDLETIFSRFGKILSCEIVRDSKTGDSLCYAFIEFEDKKSCEEAYFKMDNVLIDGNRIHVDFSQSVSKLHTSFLEKKYILTSQKNGDQVQAKLRSNSNFLQKDHQKEHHTPIFPRQSYKREAYANRGSHGISRHRRTQREWSPRTSRRDTNPRKRYDSPSPPRRASHRSRDTCYSPEHRRSRR